MYLNEVQALRHGRLYVCHLKHGHQSLELKYRHQYVVSFEACELKVVNYVITIDSHSNTNNVVMSLYSILKHSL